LEKDSLISTPLLVFGRRDLGWRYWLKSHVKKRRDNLVAVQIGHALAMGLPRYTHNEFLYRKTANINTAF